MIPRNNSAETVTSNATKTAENVNAPAAVPNDNNIQIWTELVLADTLSRSHLDKTGQGGFGEAGEVLSTRSPFEVETENVTAIDCPFISNSKIQDIQKATAENQLLQELMTTICRGWPEGKDRLNPVLALYQQFRDELVVEGGVIYLGDRCVISPSMQPFTLARIHMSHIRIGGYVRAAKDCVFRPGMNSAIKDYVSKCDICRRHDRAQPKETPKSQRIPDGPWKTVGTDLFAFQGGDYFILVDYYSGFIEVEPMVETTSKAIIANLRQQL